jgi:O-antigen chain-terminating methyltransferase
MKTMFILWVQGVGTSDVKLLFEPLSTVSLEPRSLEVPSEMMESKQGFNSPSGSQEFLDIQEVAREIRRRVGCQAPPQDREKTATPPAESLPFSRPRVFPTAALIRTEELIHRVQSGELLVGGLPPQPPTVRGRIGAWLVSVVRRMLFWYTPQIHSFQRAVTQAIREQSQALQSMETHVREWQASSEAAREFAELGNSHRSDFPRWVDRLRSAEEACRALAARVDSLTNDLSALQSRHDAGAARVDAVINESISRREVALRQELVPETLSALPSHVEWLTAHVAAETKAREAVTLWVDTAAQQFSQLESAVREADRFVHNTRARLGIQDRRITMMLEEARRRLPEPFDGAQLETLAVEHKASTDPLYLQFEDVFRGTRSDIKSRLTVYVDRIREAGLGTQSSPVLDVGCGRGEWLELLGELGMTASGVDASRSMVDQCREMKLSAELGDAVKFLAALPSESLGVVTGFHIVEHLPFSSLLTLFDEIVRVLKPGGLAIFETPNPENIFVGSCSFYLDPTHLHPLPPDFLRFLVEARGLCRVEILRLHAYPESYRIQPPSPVADFLNHHFYGPRDYAVLGKRA